MCERRLTENTVKFSTTFETTSKIFISHRNIDGKDYKNPLHIDVVDRYLRRMGDKTIPDEAPPSLE